MPQCGRTFVPSEERTSCSQTEVHFESRTLGLETYKVCAALIAQVRPAGLCVEIYRRFLDMPLITCKVCKKIFTGAGVRVCPDCQRKLDQLYLDVRDYLRDNPKEEFNVETLAEELKSDIRYVQGLVDLGYLERDESKRVPGSAEKEQQKLAKAFEDSLNKMKDSAAAAQQRKPVSYGAELYSDKAKRR